LAPPLVAWFVHNAVPAWRGLSILIAFWPLWVVLYLPAVVVFWVLPELGPVVGWFFKDKPKLRCCDDR
jgi:hypothetical protein